MGIVNVTPDSFSDGGRFDRPEAAIRHGLDLVEQGAEILDIGGESTRPGAVAVPEAEELARVLPVITALAAGASIVNDVAAYVRTADDPLWQAVAGSGAGYVAMHARGTPQTMQQSPAYADITGAVRDFFTERLERLNAAGVSADQVVFDPGIGFGKTLEHNLELLAALETFARLGRPLLAGVSRKSFIEKLLGARVNERLPASLACATLAVGAGAHILRVHDVAETVQAVRMAEAILAKRHVA